MNKKVYFIGLIKETDEISIATTKSIIARFLNINTKTIYRQLNISNPYSNNKYTIWKNVPITKLKKTNNMSSY
jgi:hypothetical protein